MKALIVGIAAVASLLWVAVWWSSRDVVFSEGANVSMVPAPVSSEFGHRTATGNGTPVASVTSAYTEHASPRAPIPVPPDAFDPQAPGQIVKPRDATSEPPPPPPPSIKPNEKGEIDLTASDPNTRMFSEVLREGYERRLRDEAQARYGVSRN